MVSAVDDVIKSLYLWGDSEMTGIRGVNYKTVLMTCVRIHDFTHICLWSEIPLPPAVEIFQDRVSQNIQITAFCQKFALNGKN